MISRAFSILIFFAALIGTGLVLSEIRPFAAVPALKEKFAWFATHADDYDTLFIGTSRIYRGIQPAVFDEATAAAGVPTHSFNLGIDAMSPPEDAYVLERIANLRPKHLRWVFIETGPTRPGVGYGGEDNVRSLHWHDTTRTVLACRSVLAPPGRERRWSALLFGSAEERRPLALAGSHVWLWLTRTLNAGRGALLLEAYLQPAPRARLSAVLGRGRDGFMPAGDGKPMPDAERADYERRFAERAAKGSRISFLDRDAQCSLDLMLTRLRALGARPVLLVPPFLHEARQYPKPGCPAPVLDYGEIEKWPALFELDHRVDRSHLNPAGADLFTRAVAADFIELARSPAR